MMNYFVRKRCGTGMAARLAGACLVCSLILGGCGDPGEELVLDRVPTSEEESVQQPVSVMASAEEASREEPICVYVCGEVCSPGVVELPLGSRAEEAVRLAGGMTDQADSNYVNLAAVLSDGEKLYIPSAEEAKELESRQEAEESGLVNINTADRSELCTLPGIGESRADDIIAYREQNGGFTSAEDIMKVPGIKTAAFTKIKEKITV